MVNADLTRCFVIAFALTLLAGGVGIAAYLESDYEASEYRPMPPPRWFPPPRPPEPPILPPPEPDWGVRRFVRSLSVGSPVQYGELTVFPLYHPSGSRSRGYLDMEEALRRGDLVIRERGAATVSEVVVTNHSSRFVLLLAGEILVGGKQNRILRRDVLIAPYSEEVVIPAYCVERGRWTRGSGGEFRGLGFMSGSGLRRSALESSSQDEVWEEVGELSRRHSYSSPTQDLSGLYEQKEVEDRIRSYRRGLRSVLREDPIGAVVWCRGRIAGAEFFVDADLFRTAWPRILGSYVVDVEVPLRGRPHPWTVPGRSEIESFLRRVERASFSGEWGPGVGTGLRISGPGIWGTTLVHRNEPVHATLFEGW